VTRGAVASLRGQKALTFSAVVSQDSNAGEPAAKPAV
jgi:hypothetical protein